MNQLSQLESDIINWMIKNLNNESLNEQLKALEFVERDLTGVGSFTTFKTNQKLKPIIGKSPINGPTIESKEIQIGAGTLLFISEDGYINQLEIYAYEGEFPEKIDNYTLNNWV